MKVIILPGYSVQNRDWALQIKDILKPQHTGEVMEWDHWYSGEEKPLNPEREINKILEAVVGEHVHILAKSVGTWMLAKYLSQLTDQIEKIILCGIPFKDLTEDNKKDYQGLARFPVERLLIIQNQEDHHGTAKEVSELVIKLNPEFKVVSKPGGGHDYPYFEDFKNFLL